MATEATKKMIDPSSPFYLHPFDNPGASVTTCLLNGDNYDMWEKAMVNALKVKNKLGFINGTLIKPDEDTPKASKWEACNSMLISWIFNSIEKSIQLNVVYLETTKEVWDDLRDRYSIGNTPRIHELKSEIASLRQQGTSFMVYYTKLKGMWDKLSSYSKVLTCTCGAAHEFLREKEEEKLHQSS
ncbi:uncharacterized protein LOC109821048 [Asparagus officinalis]|uniref:uncharacterized protein LOC109821048 n=1 Tax=Asparagus officinalis TaxID=4686 RepID=UPI00098E42C3|nr:uncharacterized protein LOC109821048 [Asparagus officinalis]